MSATTPYDPIEEAHTTLFRSWMRLMQSQAQARGGDGTSEVHFRWPNGSPPPVDGCRWCGHHHPEQPTAGAWVPRRGWHDYHPPTETQKHARALAAVLAECRCDVGDYKAEPCGAEECAIDILIHIGIPR